MKWLHALAALPTFEGADPDIDFTVVRDLGLALVRVKAPVQKRTETSVLARATEWQVMLRQPGTNSRADLARHLGVSRAWITQGMAVLDAPAPVVEAMRRREAQGRPVTQALWKRVAGMPVDEAVRALVADDRPQMRHGDRAR